MAAGPGIVLMAHGAGTTVAGARGLYSGEAKRTMTAQAVTAATGSETAGTVVDAAIPLVAGIGGVVQVARQKAAQAAALASEKAAIAQGESPWRRRVRSSQKRERRRRQSLQKLALEWRPEWVQPLRA